MDYSDGLLEILRCPETKEPLIIDGEYLILADGA